MKATPISTNSTIPCDIRQVSSNRFRPNTVGVYQYQYHYQLLYLFVCVWGGDGAGEEGRFGINICFFLGGGDGGAIIM
jgi:hypothetical protein